MPVISLSDALKMAINELNMNTVGTDGTLSPTQEKFVSGELSRLISYADATVYRMIAQMKGYAGREPILITTSGIAHGASIGSAGPIDSIICVITGGPIPGTYPVEVWPTSLMSELNRENLNPQLLTRLSPHAIVDGNVVYHNRAGLLLAGASTVSFNVRHPLQFTMNLLACQSPAEFTRAVALLALSTAIPKDGVRVEAAQLFKTMANEELASLGVSQSQ